MNGALEGHLQRKRLAALIFAVWDMSQVVSAAYMLVRDLEEGRLDESERIVIETGLIVSYARPFTRSKAEYQLRPDDEPDGKDRELHEWLLKQRHRVYAHTDETDARRVIGLADTEFSKPSDERDWGFFHATLALEKVREIALLAGKLARRYDADAKRESGRLTDPPA